MSQIKVLEERCVNCLKCIEVCPFKAISMLDNQIKIDQNTCRLCGICRSNCKHDAIVLEDNKDKKEVKLDTYKGVWVIAEQRNGQLVNVSLELLGKGRELADTLDVPLSAVIIGSEINEAAELLIGYGADIVHQVDQAVLNYFNEEQYAHIVANLIQELHPEIVLVGATSYGRALAPRISSQLNTGLTADCTELEIDSVNRNLLQTRPAFGGNLLATIVCKEHRPQMASVRPKIFKALAYDATRKGEIISHNDLALKQCSMEVIESVEESLEGNHLADAEIVVIVGRGIGNEENLKWIEELAKTLNAAIGATRAVVDCGWLDYSCQVGQTGRVISPKVCITCGVSGAIQHLTGIMSSDTIIAINNNANAPIFKVAHYGLVGDLKEILPKLITELKNK